MLSTAFRHLMLAMLCKVLLVLVALLASACASGQVAPQPTEDGSPPDPRDAGLLDASLDGTAPPLDANDELDASAEPTCPRGTTRQYIGFSAPCSFDNLECTAIAPGVECARYVYTAETCAEAGGIALREPGDDCPAGASILGTIESRTGDYSLCCRDLRSCAPQIVQPWGDFSLEPRWHWIGTRCRRFYGAGCSGPDCDGLFSSESDCLAAHEHCNRIARSCGIGSGGTCFADEYCAYPPGEECGAGDQSAICLLRPERCDDVYDPVCTCGSETYANACEASRAGQGISLLGTCESHAPYCTAPCGITPNPAITAECAALTDFFACESHTAEGSLFPCRWTTDATSFCYGP